MNARLIATWLTVRNSYWFIPSLLAFVAIIVSMVSVQIDRIVPDRWIDRIDWLHANEPEGARLLLSTIAGSMIGVAGITFSITIAAVAFASGQFGPRILSNFMRDRANQVTLGVFISTFLYCLLVLRTIQSNGDSGFIPHFSVLIGVGFAIASIGVLIHFIHHIADSIHVSSAMSRVGYELLSAVDSLFPEQLGRRPAEDAISDDARKRIVSRFNERDSFRLGAPATGYIQALADAHLLAVAASGDLVVGLDVRPGDFIATDRTLMWIWPRDRVDDALRAELNRTIAIGSRRTPEQDIRFLVEQLTDMAGRALSPGINDPYTAASCVNWLGAAVASVARREPVSPYRHDAEGQLRIVAPVLGFEEFCAETFGALRPCIETSRVAAERTMTTLHDVYRDTGEAGRRAVIAGYAAQLMQGVERRLAHPADVAVVRARYALFVVTDAPHDAP